MSRDRYRGPKLPKVLLDQVQDGSGSNVRRNNVSRKDRRKTERQQKKAKKQRPVVPQKRSYVRQETGFHLGRGKSQVFSSAEPPPRKPVTHAEPLKSILKKERPPPSPVGSKDESEEQDTSRVIPRAVKNRLQEDDNEITTLEKKLGIKGKKSQGGEQDGLDWLVDGSDSDSEAERRGTKRKRPEDAKWLRDKRMKASDAQESEENEGLDDIISESEGAGGADDKLESLFSEDEMDSYDFGGFGSEDGEHTDDHSAPQPKKQRENPYVPPVSSGAAPVTKYVPPSLRKAAGSEEEELKQLRKQIQGLLNRLSGANLLSILKSFEELYTKNARQYVTLTLVDLLVGLLSDASILNDTFLILHAGFAAAVYKVVGTDFGARLLEKVVESIDQFCSFNSGEGKQALNLIAFLACLYNFHVAGSAIIFDYVRLLLDELSESNTELLLRVIRTSGLQLRHDDPSALKDIVLLLQQSVAKIGEGNLSVRTKFMIETINNLKNNRVKAGVAASVLSAEHNTTMKKTLGSLSSSRSLKPTEPLCITLSDIRDAEKKGKWWLVGASYRDPAKLASHDSNTSGHEDTDAEYDSDTPGSVNLSKLARAHGMNTDVRRTIFITILSSLDYQHAHMRLLKLNLKSKQMLEIPRVLVHCLTSEECANPFYALVAKKFCGEHKLRKAFEFTLFDAFRRMELGEDDEEEGARMSIEEIVTLAKFYGTMIADRCMSIVVLKKLKFAYLDSKPSMFVEVLLTTILDQLRKTHASETNFDGAIKETFMPAVGAADTIQGLRYLIETRVSAAELVNKKKEKKAVKRGCRVALEVLNESVRAARATEVDEEEYGGL